MDLLNTLIRNMDEELLTMTEEHVHDLILESESTGLTPRGEISDLGEVLKRIQQELKNYR